MKPEHLNEHLNELAQCVSDGLDIRKALKRCPPQLIKQHPRLEFIVEGLYELAHWFEPILEDDEDDEA